MKKSAAIAFVLTSASATWLIMYGYTLISPTYLTDPRLTIGDVCRELGVLALTIICAITACSTGEYLLTGSAE